MTDSLDTLDTSAPVALITGAAARIGAALVARLHGRGYNILLHYRHSAARARQLAMALNASRADSVQLLQADLLDLDAITRLCREALSHWGKVNVLINNASAFYPTPLAQANARQWQELMDSNARAPFFLVQQLAASLSAQKGCIINITDIHARSALQDYNIYTMAKAALVALTKAMARDLAPDVRVNGVAPGAILWPEASMLDDAVRQAVLDQICLGHLGAPEDIAHTVLFLIEKASYMSGQIIAVDGGRSLQI
ncbi:MAG: pteridine reductase [Pseudomonadales bacterium]|nr:pteridine reductase [Pseudomonadales bacterium]